jgi:methylthioribose-1-phosphate isomerase
MPALPPTIEWRDQELYLLDQTQLPLETVIERQDTVEDVWQAINVLKVRGAPAIGVTAGYGIVVAMRPHRELPGEAFLAQMNLHADYLDSSRPTAVNLRWALDRMLAHIAPLCGDRNGAQLWDELEAEAIRIHKEDQQLCANMGEYGAPLITAGCRLLTHCNAGALATAGIGTATAPMYAAHAAGVSFSVLADETRPLLQGARLTSWELAQAGVDVRVICDNMASHLMSRGEIDLVIVGTDRVAANGDVANKIGTLGVAISANHFGIPFYVACPYSTVDFGSASGADIPIEERIPEEVTSFGARRTVAPGIAVRNPAFDVTPHELVAGLITDQGIIRPPYAKNLKALASTTA